MNKENIQASGSKQSAMESIEFSPTKQPRRIFKKTNQQDIIIEEMRADIKCLCATMEQLKDGICELAANIKQIIKAAIINSKEISLNFPIKTIPDLDDVEKRADEDPQKYTDIFKKIIDSSGGGLEKALKNIISSEIAMDFNYDGTNGKHPFTTLININACLRVYNAVKRDGSSAKLLYRKTIQHGFKRISNLHFKKADAHKKRKDALKIHTSHI